MNRFYVFDVDYRIYFTCETGSKNEISFFLFLYSLQNICFKTSRRLYYGVLLKFFADGISTVTLNCTASSDTELVVLKTPGSVKDGVDFSAIQYGARALVFPKYVPRAFTSTS